MVVPYSDADFYMVDETNRKVGDLGGTHRRHFSSRFLAKITFYAVIELALYHAIKSLNNEISSCMKNVVYLGNPKPIRSLV